MLKNVLCGAMATDNNIIVDLLANLETNVVTFQEEGDVTREIGYLYVTNPMAVATTEHIVKSIKNGEFGDIQGERILGVIMCKDGRYFLTETKAIKTNYGSMAEISSVDVDYNFEAEEQYDEDEE